MTRGILLAQVERAPTAAGDCTVGDDGTIPLGLSEGNPKGGSSAVGGISRSSPKAIGLLKGDWAYSGDVAALSKLLVDALEMTHFIGLLGWRGVDDNWMLVLAGMVYESSSEVSEESPTRLPAAAAGHVLNQQGDVDETVRGDG
jgi:hypothetical protein